MTVKNRILLSAQIYLFATLIGASVVQFQSSENGDNYTNMQVYNGRVYIGATKDIFILNASDLRQINTTRTCEGNCNNAFNKVLLINKASQTLIRCGTDSKGICQIRDLNNLEESLHNSSSDHISGSKEYLVVSTSVRRPVSFILSADYDVLYTGVTYGRDVSKSESTTDGDSYFYYLASYDLQQNTFALSKSLKLALPTTVGVEKYLVYFKASFQVSDFIYFITNQKYKTGEEEYVSKIIRFCQKDNDFWSYTDIMLECRANNKTYNLAQDVSVFKPGIELMASLNLTTSNLVMAATFTDGSDPEKPGMSSAICLYKLQDIDNQIMEAKRRFVICPGSNLTEHYYLKLAEHYCNKNFSVSFLLCNADLPSYTNIIGEISATATPVYTLSSPESGYLGNIQSVTVVDDEYTVLFAGTSRGKLIQLTVHTISSVDVSQKSVDEGYPITGLYIEPEGKVEYVMSSRKVVRYETQDCSVYKTCQVTKEAKNPLCGWCVYENRSTFKDNSSCPYNHMQGHWLSPFSQCLSITAEPRSVAVRDPKNV